MSQTYHKLPAKPPKPKPAAKHHPSSAPFSHYGNSEARKKKTTVYAKRGTGTTDDPFCYWVIDPYQLDPERVHECTEIAKQQAREQNTLAAVIRKENHDTQRGRDPETGLLTGNIEVADNHITLYLGNDIDDIQYSGHAYTNKDEYSVPIGLMEPEKRKIVQPGQEKCSTEFWPVKRQPYDKIDFSLVEPASAEIRLRVYPEDHYTPYYLRPSERNYRRYRERDRSDLPRSRFSRDRSRSPRRDASRDRRDSPRRNTSTDRGHPPRSSSSRSSRDRSRSPGRDASRDRNDPPRSSSSRNRSRSPRRDASTERRDSPRSSSSRDRGRSPRREPSTVTTELSRMSRRDHLDKNDLFYAKELPRPKPSMTRRDSPHSVPSTDKKDVDPDGKQRSRLSESERARRITSGLCVYCGKPGHRRENCPESSHTRKVETPWPDIGSLY